MMGTEVKLDATALKVCLDALLHQDGEPKNHTVRALEAVLGARVKLNEANALFIEGVRHIRRYGESLKYFSEAEEKGCTHPYLYYFLGLCFIGGCRGVPTNNTKAFDYNAKAIAGKSIPLSRCFIFSY